MRLEIGQVEALFKYPVKSMAGERLQNVELGWHGLLGDRRLAFRLTQNRGGFPWLSASRLPDLLLFAPQETRAGNEIPDDVRTPDGRVMPVFSEELAAEVSKRHGAPVQMMRMDQGIFDDASISVITLDTVGEIARLSGRSPDVRRFRPNIVVRTLRAMPFQEEQWLGGILAFGEDSGAPRVAATLNDARCSMINLDPDSTAVHPEVLKATVRANKNNAGIYGTVTGIGRLAVGQKIFLEGTSASRAQ